MTMNNNRYAKPTGAPPRHFHAGTGILLAVAAFATALCLPSTASAQITPDSAAADCLGRLNAVRNVQELRHDQQALLSVKRCIDLGIDPPLKARKDYGRSPASGVATAQIPGTTCPPFATCLYSARVNTRSMQTLNYGIGGTGSSINDMPPGSYTAPQFNAPVPPVVPQHLEGGGIIYFHGDATLTPPNTSLIYPDAGMNYYADGTRENFRNGRVMVPAPPGGDVLSQTPIIVNDDATTFSGDEYGVLIQLPRDVIGTIAGREVRGGDYILIRHEGRISVPAGTGIYPLGEAGVPPSNIAMTLTNQNQPGTGQWWSW